MLKLEDLPEVNGLAARLILYRRDLDRNPRPDESLRLAIFGLEESLRKLQCDPGSTQYAPPPTPTPPQVRLRMAA